MEEGRNQWLLVALFLMLSFCPSTRANVYATDIQINGSLQAGVVVPGAPVTISYILNDTASRVSVQIYSGTNIAKTFSSSNGAAGTNAGFNAVAWNGTNDHGAAAAAGVYNVRITAAADGYDTWTNISDDGTNFQVFYPTSITVNKNTNSPYYGRVFIGNGYPGPGGATPPGILKCNTDGSPADEGGFSTGGYPWGGGGFAQPSPWKMDVGSDDRLYVDDWAQNGAANGVVVSFDQLISTNYLNVLRPDNYPYPEISLSGLAVCGQGTNMQIFMADYNILYDGGLGLLSWTFDANGVIATNDTGTVDVALTNDSDLSLSPYAVCVDVKSNIYTIQDVQSDPNLQSALNDTNSKVLCFPPTPAGGPPDTTSLWNIGQGDPTLVNCYGVAVDTPATFVAVASRGFGCNTCGDDLHDGALSIFAATNGDLVTNFTADAEGNTNQEFFDVAWDNVGNLYTVYGEDGLSQSGWRVYSPPGSNQATTVAIPFIQVYHAITPPRLSQPAACMGQLNFTLTGQSNVTYIIQQSPDLMNWTPVATNASPTSSQTISVSPPDSQDFYRAVASP